MNLESLSTDLREKFQRCRQLLQQLGSVVVGVSGGVDSSLLLAIAVDVLGRDNVIAATATGLFHPKSETQAAQKLADHLDVTLIEINISDLEDRRVLDNPPDRCYWCKRFIFSELQNLATQQGFHAVASGSNADDTSDYRPGRRAENELDVARPLLQAGLTKQDIRQLAEAMSLSEWNKPSKACLASRIPYHTPLTHEKLARIEQAEQRLILLGFPQCRCRDHDTLVRIEVPADQLEQAFNKRTLLIEALKHLGYHYISLDLEGFRSGSLNETIDTTND